MRRLIPMRVGYRQAQIHLRHRLICRALEERQAPPTGFVGVVEPQRKMSHDHSTRLLVVVSVVVSVVRTHNERTMDYRCHHNTRRVNAEALERVRKLPQITAARKCVESEPRSKSRTLCERTRVARALQQGVSSATNATDHFFDRFSNNDGVHCHTHDKTRRNVRDKPACHSDISFQ